MQRGGGVGLWAVIVVVEGESETSKLELELESRKFEPYISYPFGVCFPLVAFFDSTEEKVDLGDDYLGERTGPGGRATCTGTGTSTQRASL